MNNIVSVLGIVLVVMLASSATQEETPPATASTSSCTVNESLLSVIKDYQKEAEASSQNLRQMVTLLPRNEQEIIAERAEHQQIVEKLNKKIEKVQQSCPQK